MPLSRVHENACGVPEAVLLLPATWPLLFTAYGLAPTPPRLPRLDMPVAAVHENPGWPTTWPASLTNCATPKPRSTRPPACLHENACWAPVGFRSPTNCPVWLTPLTLIAWSRTPRST